MTDKLALTSEERKLLKGRFAEDSITIEFDPLTAYPADELVHLTVPMSLDIIEQIDDVLDAFPSIKSREHFIYFAALYALSDIHHEGAAGLDRS